MSPCGPHREEAFRAAVEAHDFSRAEAALRDYVIWFRSESRDLPEIESARNLLQWGISVTTAHKVQLVEELTRLKRVFDAYMPRACTQTWRIVG
jgi:hypothetical protein